jgi:hypothetical protein
MEPPNIPDLFALSAQLTNNYNSIGNTVRDLIGGDNSELTISTKGQVDSAKGTISDQVLSATGNATAQLESLQTDFNTDYKVKVDDYDVYRYIPSL